MASVARAELNLSDFKEMSDFKEIVFSVSLVTFFPQVKAKFGTLYSELWTVRFNFLDCSQLLDRRDPVSDFFSSLLTATLSSRA